MDALKNVLSGFGGSSRNPAVCVIKDAVFVDDAVKCCVKGMSTNSGETDIKETLAPLSEVL